MSPEIKGNGNPPSVIKRKKKKTPNASNSASNDTLHNINIGYGGSEYGACEGMLYNEIDFLNYANYNEQNCRKTGCHMPAPPVTQPMSLPVYSNNCSGYPRYPNYPQAHPVYSAQPHIPQRRYPNFMPGPVMGPMPGPISGPQRYCSQFANIYNQGNHYFPIGQEPNNDYTSLPVINLNEEEPKDRHFSDPGLPNDSDNCSSPSQSSFDNERNNCQRLTHEIRYLKASNRQLVRELSELRMEVNLLKQSQGARMHDREYEPGMLADIIREVRDAARVREDALLARVKHIIEEKYLGLNEVTTVTNDRIKSNDRISRLEEQLKNLSTISNNNSSTKVTQRVESDRERDFRPDEASYNRSEDTTLLAITPSSTPSVGSTEKTKSARQVLELEREALELRRELQDTRARKEEADHKIVQLSKMLQRTEISTSDLLSSCEDGKTSVDSSSTVSTIATPSSLPPVPPRVILSGPVTDL